ncbi:MAG: dTMP kinase [Bacteriovoracaceae bacterium]
MNASLNQLKEYFRCPETPGSYFLSLEGIEGSGKTSQIKLIEEYFQKKGFRVLTLREPGGTTFGEKLREAILQSATPLHPIAECHLFMASRAQLLKEKILPFLLQPGSIVIVDRYIDSTLAYQGVARGLGLEVVLNLHKDEPLNLIPHRTYFLDINLQTSLKRQEIRGQVKDYFETEKHEFHQKLIEGYHLAVTTFPERILKINAAKSLAEVFDEIKFDLDKRF